MKLIKINKAVVGVDKCKDGSYDIYIDGKFSTKCGNAPTFEDTFRVIVGNIACYELDYGEIVTA